MLSRLNAWGRLGGDVEMEKTAADSMAVDDDQSEDEAPLSDLGVQPLSSSPTAGCKRAASSLSTESSSEPTSLSDSLTKQLSDCKEKIAQLQMWKDQRLKEEDYMGAHHVKGLIQEQEQKLQKLRQQLDSMPTPSRETQRKSSRVALSISNVQARHQRNLGRMQASPKEAMSRETLHRGGEAEVARAATPSRSKEEPIDDSAISEAGMDHGNAAEYNAEGGEPLEMDSSVDVEGGEGQDTGTWRRSSVQGMLELPSESAGTSPYRLPCETFDRLYGYQRTGVAWMARHWMNKKGGILADEMGLGKTVQVCAFLNGARKAGATHVLLLVPVTLLDQWAREARKWCPGWPVITYHGQPNNRARAIRRIRRPMGGILLASYQGLSNTEALYEVSIEDVPSPRRRQGRKPGQSKRRRFDDDDEPDEFEDSGEELEPEMPGGGLPSNGLSKAWDICICDEAHRMKSISTLLGKSLRKVRSNCRVLLTGTPVQNALQDLWALMDFACPGLLGNHATFAKKFSEPIDKGSVRGATPFAVQLKKHLSEQLRELINPFILRRTKRDAGLMGNPNDSTEASNDMADVDEDVATDDTDVKKLPPKKETIIWLHPSEDQIGTYQKVLESSDVIRAAAEKSKLGLEVFRAIGMLKRLCNHPLLLLPTQSVEDWAKLLDEAATQAAPPEDCPMIAADMEGSTAADEGSVPEPSDSTAEPLLGGGSDPAEDEISLGLPIEQALQKLPRTGEAILSQSAKLKCLAALLPALAARGHRTLVFSSSIKMLDLVQICCLKPLGLKCLRIDGQTDITERAEKVAKFQRETSRFQFMLLTTKVGGVGLNLTSADRVVLVDPDWNPATDAQAVDRAFRIGQQREVRVYRLIMSGLIEDKMFRLQVFKMALSRTALDADQAHRYFTSKEIRALFEWTDPAVGETRKLLNEEHGDKGEREVEEAADEDGAAESWASAGPAVGMSDFSLLFGAVAKEAEPNDECNAQIMVAKEKLGAADEKAAQTVEVKKAAQTKCESLAKELEDVQSEIELLREKRSKTEEGVKERRRELAQAKKAEDSAQNHVEKMARAKTGAQDYHFRAQQAVTAAKETVEATTKAVTEAAAGARSAEELFSKAVLDIEGHLSIADDSGKAVNQGAVDVSADKLRKAAKAVEKVRACLDGLRARQAEIEAVDDEAMKADECVVEAQKALADLDWAEDEDKASGSDIQAAMKKKGAELIVKAEEKKKQSVEQAQGKAVQAMEKAREAMAQALQALSESWGALVESFQKTTTRPVKMDQVKAAQSLAKGVHRQLSPTWLAAKKTRDILTKAVIARRKAIQKSTAADMAEEEANRYFQVAEQDNSKAEEALESKRGQRSTCEDELAQAETARTSAEQEMSDANRRRDEIKAALPLAKESVKTASAAVKEAESERLQLHRQCSKVEDQARRMEEAKDTAISSLKSEEYVSNQVEQAYQQRTGKTEA